MSKNEIFENYIVSHDLGFYDSFDHEELNLNDNILQGIFAYGFERPSPIQRLAIKPIKDGNDIVIQSHSGTGKTATFTIGILQRIDVENKNTQCIVVSNTRELADQTLKVFKSLSDFTGITANLCIGGDLQYKYCSNQIKDQVIIGTPGRISDLINKEIINTNDIKTIVIDEADDVLANSFRKQVKKIFQRIPQEAQVVLVSATIPPEMSSLFDTLLKPNFVSILIKDDQLTLDGIKQFYINIDEMYKQDAISDIYQFMNIGQGIIYCNKKHKADELKMYLESHNFSVGTLHGDMMQKERETIMKEFRSGGLRILITTDIRE